MTTTTSLHIISAALFLVLSPFLSAQALPPAGSAQTAAAVGTSASGDHEPLQNIPISSGDLLDIEVFGTPELSGRIRVDQLGQITLPVGGDVKVEGMFAKQAAAAIQTRLTSQQLMLRPIVTVSVIEYSTQGVTVLGEVKNPGIYTLLGPRSLYDALASAGGTTSSEGTRITITHAKALHPIIVEVTTTDYSAEQKATVVLPGDTIIVNRAPLVYIVGDVVRSGAFYIQGGTKLTVLNLISLAQGTNRTAAMGRASIIRYLPDGTATTITFNLNKVMKNQAPNLAMQAGDVLVLPRSGWKSFGTLALPALTNGAVNAGSTTLER